jgi:hypothetical protein
VAAVRATVAVAARVIVVPPISPRSVRVPDVRPGSPQKT